MVMTCDVVGGMAGLAKAWAEAEKDLRRCEEDASDAQRELSSARSRLESAATRLNERVGRNVPMLAVQVGDDVVIVDHERGIKRVKLEKVSSERP